MADKAIEEQRIVISYESLSTVRELQEALLNLDWTHIDPSNDRDEESIIFQRFAVMVRYGSCGHWPLKFIASVLAAGFLSGTTVSPRSVS